MLVFVLTETEPGRPWAWLLTGLAASAAMITKATAWFLLPLGIGTLAFLSLSRQQEGKRFWIDVTLYLGGLMIFPLLAWLRWPNLPTRLIYSITAKPVKPDHLTLDYLFGMFPLTHSSFWGCFGWMNLPISAPIEWVLDGILIVGLVSAVVFFVRNRSTLTIGQRQASFILAVSMVLVFCMFISMKTSAGIPLREML